MAESAPRLVEQVMASITRRIAARELASGAKLPSIRQLAASQGVSKSTVVEAYDRLAGDGAIQARPGSGFYVTGRTAPFALTEVGRRIDRAIDPLWIMRQALEGDGDQRPGCGWLPESWLPVDSIRKALRTAARGAGAGLVDYGTPLGFPPLRQQLERRLGERGIAAPPSQILLTESGSQAIDLVCRFLLAPGDTVLIDDPCYFNFLSVLQAHRVQAHGVPQTPDGPDLAVMEQLAARHRPKLYLTNASLQNPTGASLAPAQAFRLLKLAEEQDFLILEDDIFGDFAGEGTVRLAALDGLERVVYLGSFSKTLSASVRCGYIAAKPEWVEGLTDLKLATSFGNADLSARLVHQLLTDGSYRRHVEGLKTRLAGARSETARRLEAIGCSLWTEPRGGMFLWACLPDGIDSADLSRKILTEDIVLAPGNVFSISQSAGRYLRFNAAQSASPRIFEALARAMAD
ncbi:PLP-dependent aminotransferase family protein [Lacibacterium aquatile]|uniref:PLP-dependent aminotransferase family protein n=1 Tax=Lacibacterium aquatile TaxID=1168082 RepID=A0ABW5DT29_9PROT